MNIQLSLGAGALTLALLLGAPSVTQAQNAAPAQLSTTTAFISAGGGAGRGSFSSIRALSQTVGEQTLQSELHALRAKFGSDDVDRFVHAFDYSFIDGWRLAGQDDVKMPQTSGDTGKALALDLLHAGTGSDQTFRVTTMMDNLWTPRVHSQIQADIASRYGNDALANFRRVGNQFFYDLAQSLGENGIRMSQ